MSGCGYGDVNVGAVVGAGVNVGGVVGVGVLVLVWVCAWV